MNLQKNTPQEDTVHTGTPISSDTPMPAEWHPIVASPDTLRKSKTRLWDIAPKRTSSAIEKEQRLLAEALEQHQASVLFWGTMLEMELLSYILLGTALFLIEEHVKNNTRPNKDYLCSLLFSMRIVSFFLATIHSITEHDELD